MTRRALVTGGSRGIGLAIASTFAEAGLEVAVLSRTAPPPIAPPLHHLAADLRAPSEVRRVLASWLAAGAPDVVVHSAVAYGSTGRHAVQHSTVDEWDAALEVGPRGLLVLLTVVLPSMLSAGRGLIAGISSDVATGPAPGRIPYGAAKAAEHAILRGLAAETQGSGITVLELQPTVQVDTPGIRARRAPDFVPSGYASPSCFSPPARWLLTDEPPNHHGRSLFVAPDGRLLDSDGTHLD